MTHLSRWLLLSLIVTAYCAGCSIRKTAINMVGDALAGGGSTFTSDDDPELVRAAIPFSLKLMESLLAETPRHKGLLLAAAGGFTQFAYGYVQMEADEIEDRDFAAAQAMRQRARRLYLRARDYGQRGLEVRHPGFTERLRKDPKSAIAVTKKEDVPFLYWTATSWAAATSILKDEPDLIADLNLVEALIDRALVLDEAFDSGAIHSFLIAYEMGRQGAQGDPAARSRKHFERAMQISGGQMTGPLVSLAESVSVQKQDVNEFKALLDQALAIDPDARPEWRLANLLMQRRARWLLSKTEDLFLLPAPAR